jgi:hypothetical protein
MLNLAVDFHSRRSLSTGVPGSLHEAKAPAWSPLTRTPAGVERLPFQSTGLKNQQYPLTQQKNKKRPCKYAGTQKLRGTTQLEETNPPL